MTKYKWTHRQPLTRIGGEDVEPGGVFEPSEAELKSFGDRIEEVDDGGEGADSESETASGSEESGSEDYSRGELEDMSYDVLRTMASEADSDVVDGRSSKEDIIEFFANE